MVKKTANYKKGHKMEKSEKQIYRCFFIGDVLAACFFGVVVGFIGMSIFTVYTVSGMENSIKLSEVCKGVK